MLKQLDTLIGFAVVMSIVSMLIMVVTQAVSSALALRGRNLRSALEALFITLAPNLDGKKARALAEVILKRPILSDSSLSLKGPMPEIWKLASAIRPEECLAAIKKIALLNDETLKGQLAPSAQGGVNDAKEAARQVLKGLAEPAPVAAGQSALAAIQALAADNPGFAKVQADMEALLTHAAVTATGEVERWTSRFKWAQDRADQWFTIHARQVTVVVAFAAAFVLQLNAFELFYRLANDADLRKTLVAQAPGVQAQVDKGLHTDFTGTVQWAALKELNDKGEVATVPDAGVVKTDTDATAWLAEQKASPQALADYPKFVQEQAQTRLQAARSDFNQLVGVYDQSSLRLVPENYPLTLDGSFPFVHNVGAFLGWSGWRPGKAFGGMLATAMFLTLGAPFWFNVLKGLASLRSSVSEKIEQEDAPKAPPA